MPDIFMNSYKLGIDIGSTTVKIALIDDNNTVIFSDYERHFANIQETLQSLLEKAVASVGNFNCHPVITGSGGLTLAKHLEVPFYAGSCCRFHCSSGLMLRSAMLQ